MHSGWIWDLTQVYLEQKLVIEVVLCHPSWSQEEFIKLKIPALPVIKAETTVCALLADANSIVSIFKFNWVSIQTGKL